MLCNRHFRLSFCDYPKFSFEEENTFITGEIHARFFYENILHKNIEDKIEQKIKNIPIIY